MRKLFCILILIFSMTNLTACGGVFSFESRIEESGFTVIEDREWGCIAYDNKTHLCYYVFYTQNGLSLCPYYTITDGKYEHAIYKE